MPARRRLAVVLDDWALAALPGLDLELSRAGAVVVRCYERLPSPAVLRRLPECHGVAVLGGRDLASLRDRLETATATLAAPVIAALPPGQAPLPELCGPGVVDLLPAGTPRAAERVALMAWVPIVTGGARRAVAGAAAHGSPPPPAAAGAGARPAAPGLPPEQVVAIASSTGGVWVVAALLQALRHRDRAAVLLAQHMDAEFVAFFAAWLGSVTPWPAVVVEDEAPLEAGRLYLASGGRDLVAEPGRVVALSACSRYVPCADRLLGSVGRSVGPRALGLVLSGMGADGAEGLAEVGRRGGRTVCQAPSSAVVSSMPEAALRRWPGAEVVQPEALAAVVSRGT